MRAKEALPRIVDAAVETRLVARQPPSRPRAFSDPTAARRAARAYAAARPAANSAVTPRPTNVRRAAVYVGPPKADRRQDRGEFLNASLDFNGLYFSSPLTFLGSRTVLCVAPSEGRRHLVDSNSVYIPFKLSSKSDFEHHCFLRSRLANRPHNAHVFRHILKRVMQDASELQRQRCPFKPNLPLTGGDPQPEGKDLLPTDSQTSPGEPCVVLRFACSL